MSKILEKIVPMVTLTVQILVIGGCANKSNEAPIPPPGQKQILQIYILQDAARPLRSYWNFPTDEELSRTLGARVESKSLHQTNEGIETLRDISARPMDYLILGPGNPLQAWKSASVAKNSNRKIFLVGESSQDPELQSILIDEKTIHQFVASYCKKLAKNHSDCGIPKTISIRVKWTDLFNALLLHSTPTANLSFFSGFIEAHPGENLQDPDSIRSFESFHKEAMLQALSQTK